jgi:hypothetical protein
LVKELNSQLARTEPLTRSGKSSVLHLLTREAADEEKRSIEKDLKRWKGVSQEKDAIIADKDKQIAELEQTGGQFLSFISNSIRVNNFIP